MSNFAEVTAREAPTYNYLKRIELDEQLEGLQVQRRMDELTKQFQELGLLNTRKISSVICVFGESLGEDDVCST